MGFFDLFSRKKAEEPANIRREFDALKADFARMRQQVEIISSSMDVLNQNMGAMAQNDNENIRHDIAMLQAKMKDMVLFAKLSLQNHDELKVIKKHIAAEGSVSNVLPDAEGQKEIPALKSIKDMTSREREVISLLLNSEIPLSSAEIGTRLGISPVTAKGHVNSIKKRFKGIVLDVTRGKNRKDYALDHGFKMTLLGA